MTPPDEVRLRHMREAAEKAIAFAEGRTRQDLDTDELLRLALEGRYADGRRPRMDDV
jgi:hypothetical protein